MITLETTFNGHRFINMTPAQLAAAGVPEDAIVAAARVRAGAIVDARAEAVRAKYLTPGSGQALEYQEVQAQAQAANASPGNATAALYPMLAASIGLDVDPSTGAPASDVLGVARAVLARYAAWLAAGAAIRAVRLKAKAAIDAATTIDAVLAVPAAVVWPASNA